MNSLKNDWPTAQFFLSKSDAASVDSAASAALTVGKLGDFFVSIAVDRTLPTNPLTEAASTS
jgi:hypothetical protein